MRFLPIFFSITIQFHAIAQDSEAIEPELKCVDSHWNNMDVNAKRLNSCFECQEIEFISQVGKPEILYPCQVRFKQISQQRFLVCTDASYSDCAKARSQFGSRIGSPLDVSQGMLVSDEQFSDFNVIREITLEYD